MNEIPVHFLASISTCYSQKILSCRWCFLTHLQSTQQQLLSSGGVCKKCLCQKTGDEIITVIPASNLCERMSQVRMASLLGFLQLLNIPTKSVYLNIATNTIEQQTTQDASDSQGKETHGILTWWTVEYKQSTNHYHKDDVCDDQVNVCSIYHHVCCE